MKERGILFNSDMVRAILDGRKTNTMRPVKAPVLYKAKSEVWKMSLVNGVLNVEATSYRNKIAPFVAGGFSIKSPYGKVGDRLYVRETFLIDENKKVMFKADGYDGSTWLASYFVRDWTPSIHMPRKLSRIDLEITGVDFIRVQDINEEIAITEGVNIGSSVHPLSHRKAFKALWNKVYGNWDDNPWAWSYRFEVVAHRHA